MVKVYRSFVDFNKDLAERFETFDLDASNRSSRFCFSDTDGVEYQAFSGKLMFQNLNTRFGEFIDWKRSSTRTRTYVVSYLEEDESGKVTPTVTEEDAVTETTPVYDKEYAEGLYNEEDKVGSKDLLEEYGKTLGIDLKKNLSFPNMIKQLEEFLDKE